MEMDAAGILELLHSAVEVKAKFQKMGPSQELQGRSAALIFEKPSLRTRVTFEVAMVQLGGAAIYLSPSQIALGKRETVADAAHALSRWVDVIVARTFSHQMVEDLARYASVPVINALTDKYHPCQALALGQTLLEHKKRLEGLNLVFVGDGNNVANSIAAMAGHLGMNFTLACPRGYEQPEAIQKEINRLFEKKGTSYRTVHEPVAAVANADLIYTDVWVSMGEEGREAEKKDHFQAFQVNEELLSKAPKGCLVSHCLPAHRGEEITDAVMESPACVCFDEAENRLHAQKAVLLALLKK